MAGAAGFTISILAKDQTTAAFASVNKALKQMEAAAKSATSALASPASGGGSLEAFSTSVTRASGLVTDFGRGAVEHFGRIGTAARTAARAIGEIAPPLAGLGAAASIGGLVALSDKFARAGGGITRTAAGLGVSTKAVQEWGGAFERAGLSADDAASSIAGMRRTMFEARMGTNASAIGVLRQFGISASQTPMAGILEAADRVKELNDRGVDTEAQGTLLDKLGISRTALPLLQRGSAAIRELIAETDKAGIVDDAALQRAQQLERAWIGLGQSARYAGYSVAAQLAPTLSDIFGKMSEWLDKPANQKWLGAEIERFLKFVEGLDISKITDLAKSIASLFGGDGTGATAGGIAAVAGGLGLAGMFGGGGLLGTAVRGIALGGRGLAALLGVPVLGPILGALGLTGAAGAATGAYTGSRAQSGESVPVGAPEAFKHLTDLGMPKELAAGMLANAAAESGFNPAKEWTDTDGLPSGGLFAWHGERLTRMKAALGNMSKNAIAQIDYALKEMAEHPELAGRFFSQSTGAEAGREFAHSFERPAAGEAEWNRRGAMAETLLKKLTAPPPSTGIGGALLPQQQSAVGAYGVPGAVMNYGNTGALGAPGSNLVWVTTNSGQRVRLNAAAAPSALAFLNELEGRGYKIDSLGGFSNREKRGGSGLSEHAFGDAFDINPNSNPFRGDQTDLPADIHDLAAKHGWIWGGDWQSPRDPMHFQWGGPGAGAVAPVETPYSGGKTSDAGQVTGRIDVHFANAPPGTRTGLRDLAGPLDVGLRTQYAMGVV
ncbi:MAG: M15 family metallopeptidase [Alphaproteobacteria bacterium]|nr:M15 family metallopeptidase [Alphaproteobacteria bacterium]